jgi:hypothetical protein
MNSNASFRPKPDIDLAQMRRLHYWLSYNRYSIFIYGGGFFLPAVPILLALILLAIVFAPYMLYVLYKNRKHGWLVAFAIMVGIPLPFAFLSTGSVIIDTGLHFLPLLTFYFYCYLLRFSVGEWISDASPIDELWTEEENTQNRLGQ